MEVTDNGKHPGLLRYGFIYDCKKFYSSETAFTAFHFLQNLQVGSQ